MTLRDLAKRLRPSNPYNVRYLERIMRHGGAGFDLAQRMGKLLNCDPMVFLHGQKVSCGDAGRTALETAVNYRTGLCEGSGRSANRPGQRTR